MTDNELIAAIITTLTPGIQTMYGTQIIMLQKDQPTQQGVPSAATVFVEKLFDKRYGFQSQQYDFSALPPDSDPLTPLDTNYTQLYETTIQISALAQQDPTNTSLPTASDLVNYVAMLLGTDPIIQTLRTAGANVERITQVRNPYFHDDAERFEAHPSFDIVFQHERDLDSSTPPIQDVNIGIYPV